MYKKREKWVEKSAKWKGLQIIYDKKSNGDSKSNRSDIIYIFSLVQLIGQRGKCKYHKINWLNHQELVKEISNQ